MMKNKQRFLMITLLSCLMILLVGCSLAKEDAGSDTKDTLIGAFITDEYLDLFDLDAYLDGNASKLLQNPGTVINDTDGCTNPLYAKTDRKSSKDPSDWKISFDGIKGLNLLNLIWTDENDTICRALQSSDGICDAQIDWTESDNSTETVLSATIYTVPQGSDKSPAYYVNPVYQTSDGKIYVVPGSGISNSSISDESDNMSICLNDQTDSMEKWITKTEKCSVTVRFSSMFKPVKITLIQMDEKNQVLKQEEYIPGNLPDQLTAEKDTSYFVIETEKKAPDGRKEITRDIYECKDSDDEVSLETFYAMDNKIVSKQYTEIKWDN